MQPAEIRDLVDDFGLKAGPLIQESQLFFSGAVSSAKFRTTRHSRIPTWCCCLSGDLVAKLLVCPDLKLGITRQAKIDLN